LALTAVGVFCQSLSNTHFMEFNMSTNTVINKASQKPLSYKRPKGSRSGMASRTVAVSLSEPILKKLDSYVVALGTESHSCSSILRQLWLDKLDQLNTEGFKFPDLE
jgi:hypothetical protein